MNRQQLAVGAAVIFALTIVNIDSSYAVDTRKAVKMEIKKAKEKTKKAVRGGMVYKAYCLLCHGKKGDGVERSTMLHSDLRFAITHRDPAYYEKIIRGGGVAVERSALMPTWQDELSEEQITDVVEYLSMIINPVSRGEIVFKTNCILCHGIKGNGKGRSSVLYNPPPANLTRSDKNTDYKRLIVTLGGEAMGRSAVMPVWGLQLTKQEIEDVVAYIDSIVIKP